MDGVLFNGGGYFVGVLLSGSFTEWDFSDRVDNVTDWVCY